MGACLPLSPHLCCCCSSPPCCPPASLPSHLCQLSLLVACDVGHDAIHVLNGVLDVLHGVALAVGGSDASTAQRSLMWQWRLVCSMKQRRGRGSQQRGEGRESKQEAARSGAPVPAGVAESGTLGSHPCCSMRLLAGRPQTHAPGWGTFRAGSAQS